MTKFLLDSGDPDEYREITKVAKENNSEIWGATTNPTLIAKKLAGKKISQQEAFELQKQIVLEIIDIVPGAVSAEVYADEKTTAMEMAQQGQEIAKWHERVVVKLPTTVEGFIARTALRKNGIPTNNTLVFSQQQVFAICLHEQLVVDLYKPSKNLWPTFISPFVGRLDDISENGMDLVRNSMKIKSLFQTPLWILEASVRTPEHIRLGIESETELITGPAKLYKEWFTSPNVSQNTTSQTNLKSIPYWNVPQDLLKIKSMDEFMDALNSKKLDITHPLTDKGITRFAQDWKAIISSSM